MELYDNISAALESGDIGAAREAFGELAKALMEDFEAINDGGYHKKWADDMYAALNAVLTVAIIINSTDHPAMSDEEANAFIDKLIEEYKNGRDIRGV